MRRSLLIPLMVTLGSGLLIAGVFLVPTVLANVRIAGDNCRDLPSHAELRAALADARAEDNAGFDLDMWATIVNRDGTVCAVAFTGDTRGDQWPGSRVISAQKANTANAFSLEGLAVSTANLYSLVQPGESLYGLQHSNPVDTDTAYRGNARHYGQANDPMTNRKIGGVNVFGGGVALYDPAGNILGGLGVSGDTACADHFISWRVRHGLDLHHTPTVDNIIFDITQDANGHPVSASGFGHPHCLDPVAENQVLGDLPGN